MQPPPHSNGVSTVVHLCDLIRQIIEDYITTHQSPSEADIEPFRLEVQTLYKFLDLFEKIRHTKESRLDFEESHLRDINRLLRRCQRTLLSLRSSLEPAAYSHTDTNGHGGRWDLKAPTFTVPRFYISFYTRTLEISLMGIHLLHRWKGQLPPDDAGFSWQDLCDITQALTMSVIQRRKLTEGGHDEESVEERGLLRDVEQCVKSAQLFINIALPEVSFAKGQPSLQISEDARAHSQLNEIPHWIADLPLRNGSRTSSSPPNSKTEDYASDDSEVESIDPEIDHEVGFSAETYAEMFTTLMRDLREKMGHRNYRDAEVVCKTIVKHSIERETNLRIPFDNRPELDETLAEICLEQKRHQKAKKVLRQLLRHRNIDPTRKSRLHLLLARAYYGRDQLTKAETLAQASLRAREDLYGKEHQTTQESALLLITIYEQQGDLVTANTLRRIYCPHLIPPPPPKSAMRSSRHRLPPSPLQPSNNLHPLHHQSPPGYDEDNFHQNRNRVHWAPDVVAGDSGINALNNAGQTQLIYAIHAGDDEYVRLTLKRGASVETRCADTISPLMHAITMESVTMVEILLEHNADVEVCTSGWTPLHKTTGLGNLVLMERLIDAGADVEAKSPWEFIQPRSPAARMRAVARDEPDLEADVLRKENQRWTPLLRAAAKGHEAAVRLLLKHDATIEARNTNNATPLICASENLHFSIVNLLLERGSNPHAADAYGWTPLHRCLANRSTDQLHLQIQIINLLLNRSADINAKCNHGCTPLHYAVKKNHPADIVVLLLARKADIEARDSADLTPLHTAIDSRLEPMVHLLLDHGADASAMNGDGDDALAAAKHALRQSPEITDLLTKHKKKMKRENCDAALGRGGSKKSTFTTSRRVSTTSRRVSTTSSGIGAADAVAESSRKGEKKGLFGRKSSKGGKS